MNLRRFAVERFSAVVVPFCKSEVHGERESLVAAEPHCEARSAPINQGTPRFTEARLQNNKAEFDAGLGLAVVHSVFDRLDGHWCRAMTDAAPSGVVIGYVVGVGVGDGVGAGAGVTFLSRGGNKPSRNSARTAAFALTRSGH